jgi:hypothetical protein
MSCRAIRVGVGAVAASTVLMAAGAGSAQADPVTCTWGGNPAEPTGVFTLTPGITNTPAPEPLKLKATGELAGDARCKGTMTFKGQANAGSTCPFLTFEGTVKGLPGVTRFWGGGNAVVHEFLYDKQGNVVGSDQPVVAPESDNPGWLSCNTSGVTRNHFSSTVQLYD